MRIVGGEWGGRTLVAPKGQTTRPTSDRVREAVFNILGADVEDARVLDLFAGTGAVGLEALSRGARKTVSVERDRAALAALRTNRERLGASALEVHAMPVDRFVARIDGFDLIYLDPPWTEVQSFLSTHADKVSSWLEPGGQLVVESAKREGEPPELPGLEGPDVRVYGDALVSFYVRTGPAWSSSKECGS